MSLTCSKQVRELESRLEELLGMHAWSKVAVAEKDLEACLDQREQLEKKRLQLSQQASEEAKQLQSLQEEAVNLNSDLQQHTQNMTLAASALNEGNFAHQRALEALRQAEDELNDLKDQRKRLQRDLDGAKKDLAAAQKATTEQSK